VVDIAHSKLVTQRFRERGIRAVHVDGETPRDERRAAIRGLDTGEVDVVSNCALISEGVDVPAIGAVLLLRPTKSLALHLQQVGRALRPALEKEKARILDHAGNIFRHGLPDADRTWDLEGHCADNEAETGAATALKRCESCGAVNQLAATMCCDCGAPFPARARVEVDRPLVEVDWTFRIRAMRYRARLQWAGGDAERLRKVAAACGYKPGWVYHRLQEIARGQA
jgi:superfamily II DNA or RNA helicase